MTSFQKYSWSRRIIIEVPFNAASGERWSNPSDPPRKIATSQVLINFDLDKLSIKFGNHHIISNGKMSSHYNEAELKNYMKNSNIDINLDISGGSKNFTAYTMDLTKKYIDINADYRS